MRAWVDPGDVYGPRTVLSNRAQVSLCLVPTLPAALLLRTRGTPWLTSSLSALPSCCPFRVQLVTDPSPRPLPFSPHPADAQLEYFGIGRYHQVEVVEQHWLKDGFLDRWGFCWILFKKLTIMTGAGTGDGVMMWVNKWCICLCGCSRRRRSMYDWFNGFHIAQILELNQINSLVKTTVVSSYRDTLALGDWQKCNLIDCHNIRRFSVFGGEVPFFKEQKNYTSAICHSNHYYYNCRPL